MPPDLASRLFFDGDRSMPLRSPRLGEGRSRLRVLDVATTGAAAETSATAEAAAATTAAAAPAERPPLLSPLSRAEAIRASTSTKDPPEAWEALMLLPDCKSPYCACDTCKGWWTGGGDTSLSCAMRSPTREAPAAPIWRPGEPCRLRTSCGVGEREPGELPRGRDPPPAPARPVRSSEAPVPPLVAAAGDRRCGLLPPPPPLAGAVVEPMEFPPARPPELRDPARRRGDVRDASVRAVGTDELLALAADKVAVALAAAVALPALASCPTLPAERGLELAVSGPCRLPARTDLVTGLGLPLPPLPAPVRSLPFVATDAWLALARSCARLPAFA